MRKGSHQRWHHETRSRGETGEIREGRRAIEVQAALYQISQAAHAAGDIEALCREIHTIVARLMPAENLYIALYDAESSTFSFPYYVDQVDTPPEYQEPVGHGLTAYVLRTGRPLLATPEVFAALLAEGEVEEVGAPSLDWLGVPLRVRERTIGVLAVQSYTGTVRYGEAERDLLEYVSAQIAQIIERTRAEHATRESQRMLQTLMSNLPGMVYRCRNDAGWTMEFVSEGCLELTGYQPADLIDSARVSYQEIVHPDDRERLQHEVRGALARGRPFELTYRIITASGALRWVWERGRGVPGGAGAPPNLEGFIADVTESRQASEALHQSQERYRLIFDHAPIGLAQYDARGVIVACNGSACEILGAPRERLIGFDMIREIRDERAREALAGALAGTVTRFEGHYTAVLSGKVTPVAVLFGPLRASDGSSDGGICLVEDITERFRAQSAIQASDERSRLALQATQEIMYDWDIVTGTIIWNSNVARVLGYNPVEFGTTIEAWGRLIHPEDRERVSGELERALQDHDAFESEYRFCRRTGEYAVIYDRGLILRDASGTAIRMVGAMSDQTAHRNLELQLRQSQKMEAVGQLAGGVAHDFNNLLTAILGSTELLQRRLGPHDSAQDELATIHRAGERAAELTRGLLAYARRQILTTNELDLNEVIEHALPLLRRMIPENIDISFAAGPGLGTLRGDHGQLTQIIMNLCVNAKDALPGGGRITIQTVAVSQAEPVAMAGGAAPAGRQVRLSVSDNGRGIATDDLPHVFEPFYTTKEPGEGTGMGLSVVYGIVQQHGGTVHLESTPGRGTTVTILLPASSGSRSGPPAAHETAATSSGETILIVEDEGEVRSILGQILTGLGYIVVEAADGQEALGILDERGAQIDLVITDVVMPNLGGKDLYDAVRTNGPGPAFLFSSGYAETQLDETLARDAHTAFLGKPYGINALAAKVREVLDQRLRDA